MQLAAVANAGAGELTLDAGDATIDGGGAKYQWRAESLCIGYWNDVNTWLSWEIDVLRPGTVTVEVVQSCAPEAVGSEFAVEIGGAKLPFAARATKNWKTFDRFSVGEAALAAAGRATVTVRMTKKGGELGTIGLRGLVLHGGTFVAAMPVSGSGEAPGVSQRIGERAVRFYPKGADLKAHLPSLALEREPNVLGDAPADWTLTPTFATTTINPARWGRPEGGEPRWTAHLPIPPGTSLYGTGETAGPLLRNGRRTICWNTDAFAYDDKTWSLYQSHPWVLAVRPDGAAFGILADTTWQCEIDLTDGIRFTADGPPFGVIVIEAGSPQEVVKELANLTGKMPLPPRWALGFQQCRYSYFPDARVREVASEFRRRQIPCDVIWMDIDYMDGFRVFTFDPKLFPDPKQLNADLHAQGFKTVWMIDPGVKVDPDYFVYQQGTAGDHWVKTAAGEEFHGDVWPGACVFPDFTRPETRAWWAGLYKEFMATGIDGVWNDMNEPAVFNVHSMTMPLDNRHRGGGDLPEGPHARYHNVYGRLMVQGSREGIQAANPDKRPFVLTRASFIGGQRFAATWTGDNVANEEHLEWSVPMMLNLGLSGQPFCGPDIGGFEGDGDGELFARWMGIGALLPFARAHAAKGTRDKEPWAWGWDVESSCRRSLERRYRLLPYLYTLFHEASVTGLPVMRPLFFADPTDPTLRTSNTSFLLGDDLLVETKPEGRDQNPPRQVAGREGESADANPPPGTPRGIWRTISLVDGDDQDAHQPALKIRGGAIIPLGRIVQNTTEASLDPLTLLVCLDEKGEARGELYEDAGDGYGYRDGQYLLTRFEARKEGEGLAVKIGRQEGSLPRPQRRTVVEWVTEKQVFRGSGDESQGIVIEARERDARPKALLIGIDGLRFDALMSADAPNLKSLMHNGCWTDQASANEVTVSGPGWSSILCGVWMDKHGAKDNKFEGTNYDAYPHFFIRIHERAPGLYTAHFVSWLPIDEKILGGFKPDFRAAFDNEKDDGDNKITPLACETLSAQNPDVTFVYFGDVDTAGHAHGFSTAVPEYLAEIEDTDRKVGRLLDAVRSRPTYENEAWLFLVITDHGGTLDKKHGRNEPVHRNVLFIASSPLLARGRLHQVVNQTDVAPTIMEFLGRRSDENWDLDGRSLCFPGRGALGFNLIFNGGAERSSGHADPKQNAGAAGWRDWGAMTVVPYGAPDGLPGLESRGPTERGKQFFCGGGAQFSEMSQMVDLANLAETIDGGRVEYTLSGWFGGYADQRDMAWLEASFLSAEGVVLAEGKAGPVTLEDRRREIGGEKLQLNGLLERATKARVPIGTRRIEVRLKAEAAEGDNDGYADNLSLVLGVP